MRIFLKKITRLFLGGSMKKIFFFFLLFVPMIVSASSIKNLEVLNGELSRKFEATNNVYSVKLNDEEDKLLLKYELEDESSSVLIEHDEYKEGEENITKLNVLNSDGSKETYTFYLEKDKASFVFNEAKLNSTSSDIKVIPHLKLYVGLGCFIVILFLFKIIVLGFKKKK